MIHNMEIIRHIITSTGDDLQSLYGGAFTKNEIHDTLVYLMKHGYMESKAIRSANGEWHLHDIGNLTSKGESLASYIFHERVWQEAKHRIEECGIIFERAPILLVKTTCEEIMFQMLGLSPNSMVYDDEGDDDDDLEPELSPVRK